KVVAANRSLPGRRITSVEDLCRCLMRGFPVAGSRATRVTGPAPVSKPGFRRGRSVAQIAIIDHDRGEQTRRNGRKRLRLRDRRSGEGMKTTRARHLRRAALFAASAVCVAAAVVTAGAGRAIASPASGGANPVVRIDDGIIRGASAAGVSSFLGLPYAAPPTGNLRWRPPQPAAAWTGVRNATRFRPSCPQTASPFLPPG